MDTWGSKVCQLQVDTDATKHCWFILEHPAVEVRDCLQWPCHILTESSGFSCPHQGGIIILKYLTSWSNLGSESSILTPLRAWVWFFRARWSRRRSIRAHRHILQVVGIPYEPKLVAHQLHLTSANSSLQDYMIFQGLTGDRWLFSKRREYIATHPCGNVKNSTNDDAKSVIFFERDHVGFRTGGPMRHQPLVLRRCYVRS